jgi:hypothetical protein
MKKLLKYLPYLPVILVGIGATVVVVHMWHVTEIGRAKVGGSRRSHGTIVEENRLPADGKQRPVSQ